MNITDSCEEPTRHTNFEYNIHPTQWNQVTPQYMPWGHSPASPAAPLVTFTATSQNNQLQQPGPSGINFKSNAVSHCKRRAEFDISA